MNEAPTLEDPGYFARLAEVEATHWWALGMWRIVTYWLDRHLKGRSGLRALDVGCGTGLAARRLASRLEIQEVVGLDPSPEALAFARSCHGFPLALGDARRLPFADQSFDLAVSLDVWQHLPPGQERLAALELRRILRPGGLVVIRANARGWWPGNPGYGLHDLTEILKRSGFLVRRASYANALPSLLAEFMARLPGFRRSSRAGHPSGRGLRIQAPPPWVNFLMSRVSNAEAWILGRVGLPMPAGHSAFLLAEAPIQEDRRSVDGDRNRRLWFPHRGVSLTGTSGRGAGRCGSGSMGVASPIAEGSGVSPGA